MKTQKRRNPQKGARNQMVCWNSNTDQVVLVNWPDLDRASRGYMNSSMACYLEVREERSFEKRKLRVFLEAMHLIVREGVDPMAVHKAFMGLEEYRAGCAFDMPGMEHYCDA